MLDNDKSFKPFLGLALIVAILLGGLYYFFHILDINHDKKHTYLLIVSIILILSIVFMKIISLFLQFDFSEIGYIFPAAMGAMLIKLLINERMAIAFSVILGICGSIIFNEGITGTLQVNVAFYIMIKRLGRDYIFK